MQGHINKRVRTCNNGRKSTLWYVVIDLPRGAAGERRQKWHGGFQIKKAAEAVRARLVHELTTGFYVEPSRMVLSEWLIDHWLPVHKTRVNKNDVSGVPVGDRPSRQPETRWRRDRQAHRTDAQRVYQQLLATDAATVKAGWLRRR